MAEMRRLDVTTGAEDREQLTTDKKHEDAPARICKPVCRAVQKEKISVL